MELIEGLDNIPSAPYKNAVVTIGNFDGVHKGHQAMIAKVKEKAAEINGTSVVLTFEPHPARVLSTQATTPLITVYKQKKGLIKKTGVDVLICINFTREFASLKADAFVKDILVNRIGAKTIIIGKDYAFGKNREGDVSFLKAYGSEMGFEVIVLDWIFGDNRKEDAESEQQRISSTAIRELVSNGHLRAAAELLGRHYQVRGEVVSGRGRGGASLGFPTANIVLSDELCPANGVYAVLVEYDSQEYKGVANIGYSPTFGDHIFTVEVHMLNFSEQINGKNIKVNFVQRIRDEQKFAGVDELRSQIEKDIERAEEIFKV